MNTKFLALITISVATIASADSPTITPFEASKHVGEVCEVTGPVTDTHTAKGCGYLDFGGMYPHQVFTAYLPNASILKVEDQLGKILTITGTVTQYKGNPEIVVTSKKQVKQEAP